MPIGIAALAVADQDAAPCATPAWTTASTGPGAALLDLLRAAAAGLETGRERPGSTNAIICYVIEAVAAIGFLWWSTAWARKADLPLAMFRNKTVGVASIASVLIGVAMFGVVVALPLYLQIVKGATPTGGRLLLLPMTSAS